MAKKIEKSLKEAIKRVGFVFENKVYNYLVDQGWRVDPNRYYYDKYTGFVDEYDMIAFKTYKLDNNKFHLAVLIECQYLKGPLAFFVRNLKNEVYPIKSYFGENFKKFFNFETLAETINSTVKYKKMFFSEEQVYGFQYFKKGGGDNSNRRNESKKDKNKQKTNRYEPDKERFDATNKSIKKLALAVNYERTRVSKQEARRANEFHLFFPLLVLKGDLIKTTLTKNRTNFTWDNFFRYKISIPTDSHTDTREYYIYITDFERIKKVLVFYSSIFNKCRDKIKKQYQKYKRGVVTNKQQFGSEKNPLTESELKSLNKTQS